MSKVAGKLNKNINSKKNKNIKIKMKKQATATGKRKAKAHKATKKVQEKELIIIDEKQGLIFENDKTLFGYFSVPIKEYETRYQKYFDEKNDFSDVENQEHESLLEETLDDPDEIWIDDHTFEDLIIHTLVKSFETKQQAFHYIAVVYINTEDNYPTFVFMHFPTKDSKMLEAFRQSEIIFHRKLEAIQFAAIEGDSLLEGDYLAIGLLESMIKLRGEKDIAADKFKDFEECRESTIDSPDEIWRKVDSTGHILVTFIKEFGDMGIEDLHYIVVTEEDTEAQVNSLLFSFPTNDTSLVDRYRQGENLEAEEVATESSH
ncbi:MAG: PBECR2 nuclease fold domain-containing protein [Pseudobdellovibrio sp.]